MKGYNIGNHNKKKIPPFGTHFIKISKTITNEVDLASQPLHLEVGTFKK